MYGNTQGLGLDETWPILLAEVYHIQENNDKNYVPDCDRVATEDYLFEGRLFVRKKRNVKETSRLHATCEICF